MPASHGKRRVPPPAVSRAEVRAFCMALARHVDVNAVLRPHVDPAHFFHVGEPKRYPLPDPDNRFEFERRIALVDAVKLGLEAAIKVRLDAAKARKKPRATPAPALPAGWAYAAAQERRPRYTPGHDHGAEALVIARRGTRRVLFRLSSKAWGGVGGDRYTYPAELVLELKPGDRAPLDTAVFEGRYTAAKVANGLDLIRAYLGTPALLVEHLDRNRTLVIPE